MNDSVTQCCTHCGREKPLAAFYQRKDTGKPRRQCKACYVTRVRTSRQARADAGLPTRYQENYEEILRRARRQYLEDPEKFRKRTAEYARRNREKRAHTRQKRRDCELQAQKVPYSNDQKRQRLSMFGNRCYLCGGNAEATDHVKPLAKGGWDCLANIRPICTSCNSRKGTAWPLSAAIERIAAVKTVDLEL